VSQAIISVRDLGKRYRLGHATAPNTLRDRLAQGFGGLLARNAAQTIEDFWALRDVAFDVREGEVVGIIGRNGAGKSTLLKILSQITEPTTGEVRIRGRVASLLEVGTGFHHELSGRENIYLNGAILGMRKAEIDRKFDEIVDFSGVERFLDTPVKRYSSGMTVRLAFAVAAHLEPEVLLIDEVLAVGDIEFQNRCLGKMGEVASGGRTVLFVSHNLPYIERLCDRAIHIDKGAVVGEGSTAEVIRHYLSAFETGGSSWSASAQARETAHFTRVSLLDEQRAPLSTVTTESTVILQIECAVPRQDDLLQLGVCVFDSAGQALVSTNPLDGGAAYPNAAGSHTYELRFPKGLFVPQRYQITTSLYSRGKSVDLLDKQIAFDVIPVASQFNVVDGKRPGLLYIRCDWAHAHRA
jgi:lipopolysaccharide transport system ATP-binding protein